MQWCVATFLTTVVSTLYCSSIRKDTHALRMLQSRLGASFTTAVPFIFAVLVISVFSANNLVTVDGLKPDFSIDIPKQDNTFKYINIQLSSQAFVAAPTQFVCDDPTNGIQLIDSERAPHLKCAQTTSTSRAVADNNMVACAFTFNCSVDSSLSGVQDVVMAFPTAFQVISWNVASSTWEGGQKPTNISHVLNPTQNNMLVGNDKVPTVLEFSVSRAQYLKWSSSAEQENTTDYGLKLAWNRIIREEAENGVKEATHIVAFRFNVADTIYVKEISMKLAILTRFGTVLTLLLTAMSSMKFVKVQLQRCIDHCIKTKAKKDRAEPAEDVLRRERVLDEHAITNTGNKMRRLSSKTSNTKPERKRRLSSRDLMQQEQVSTRSQIELTVMNGDRPEDVFSAFTNPMRQQSNNRAKQNPVGRRRRSSAPSVAQPPPSGGALSVEEKVAQLMRDNIELKKNNVAMKNELKKNKIEMKNEFKNELKKKSIEMKKDNMEMKKQLMEMRKIMATQGMLNGKSKTDANPNTNRKQRTKRLSKVMMARRNSTVKMVDPTEDEDEDKNEDDMDNDWEQMNDETTGQVYYVNNKTGDSQCRCTTFLG